MNEDQGKQGKQGRSWIEEHGATIFGYGVFVVLGLIAVAMRLRS